MSTVREALVEAYGEDWERLMSHVIDVADSRYPDYRPLIVLNLTQANNTFGYDDPVTVSNYRVLQERWSGLEGLSRGPWSNCDAVALDLDSEAPKDLTEVLDSLADYPLLDEQEWSTVEQEMIEEHWESYGLSDTVREVEKAIDADTLTDAAEEIIKRLVWEGILDYGAGGGYPTMIDVSACDFGEEAVAQFFADHLGEVVTVKSRNGYGEDITLDLTRENIIEA